MVTQTMTFNSERFLISSQTKYIYSSSVQLKGTCAQTSIFCHFILSLSYILEENIVIFILLHLIEQLPNRYMKY